MPAAATRLDARVAIVRSHFVATCVRPNPKKSGRAGYGGRTFVYARMPIHTGFVVDHIHAFVSVGKPVVNSFIPSQNPNNNNKLRCLITYDK